MALALQPSPETLSPRPPPPRSPEPTCSGLTPRRPPSLYVRGAIRSGAFRSPSDVQRGLRSVPAASQILLPPVRLRSRLGPRPARPRTEDPGRATAGARYFRPTIQD